MTRLIASLTAMAISAVPAFAEFAHPRKTIPKGSYTIRPYDVTEVERHYSLGEGIYNNLQGPTVDSLDNRDFFVGDDAHMLGGTVTGFHWIYVDNGMIGPNTGGSHSSTLAFFYNTPGDGVPLLGNTATFTSGGITFGAVFLITGLPQWTINNQAGGWLISVTLPSFVTGPDCWVGIASSSANPTRLGLRAGNGPTVGRAPLSDASHDLYWSGFYTSPPYTSFFSVTAPVSNADLRIAILGSAGVPAATVTTAVSRRTNPHTPGTCDTNLLPPRKSEPHLGGIQQVRIGFNVTPGTPSGSGVTLESATCPTGVFGPDASPVSSSVVGNELVLAFTPALANGRTYKIMIGPDVTSIAGQTVEVRGLMGDLNSDGRVNATDRSLVNGAWTGGGFTCPTDLNNSGATNATDLSLVGGAWTGGTATSCAP